MSVEKRRMALVLSLLAIGSAVSVVGNQLALGWKAAAAAASVLNLILAVYLLVFRDRLIASFTLFGVVVGFGELVTDHYAVAVIDILVYNPGGPFLWSSPLYMPFAWVATMVEFAYIGYWLSQRMSLIRSAVVTAVVGGLFLPANEAMAKAADFWVYRNSWMILDSTPVFLIPAEALLLGVLPLIARRLETSGWAAAAALGVLQGVWILVLTVVFFQLLGQKPF